MQLASPACSASSSDSCSRETATATLTEEDFGPRHRPRGHARPWIDSHDLSVGYGRHGPPPTGLWPLTMGIASTLTLCPVAPGTYELREGTELRGTLARYATQPRIVIADAAWDLTGRRARLGWYAVATRQGTSVADVAYYPGWISGGTIAFEHQRYRLRQVLFLGNDWRLRDADRAHVATIDMVRPSRREDALRLPRFTITADWAARARPEFPLLLIV